MILIFPTEVLSQQEKKETNSKLEIIINKHRMVQV